MGYFLRPIFLASTRVDNPVFAFKKLAQQTIVSPSTVAGEKFSIRKLFCQTGMVSFLLVKMYSKKGMLVNARARHCLSASAVVSLLMDTFFIRGEEGGKSLSNRLRC